MPSKKVRNFSRQNSDYGNTDYRAVLEAMGDIVYKINPQGQFVYINNSIKVLGYEPFELIGEHFSIIIHPDDIDTISRETVLPRYAGMQTGPDDAPKLFDERRNRERMTRNLEVRLLPKGFEHSRPRLGYRFGTAVAFGDISASGQYDAIDGDVDRRFLGTVGVIRDITILRQAEKKLRHREELAKAALDAQHDAFVVFAAKTGQVLWSNRALLKLAHWKKEESTHNKIYELYSDDAAARIKEAVQEAVDAGCAVAEAKVRTATEGEKPFEFSYVAVDDEDRHEKYILAVGRDLTERIRMEHQHIQTQKLHSLMLLAGGIAHDFSNMLTGIKGNIQLAKSANSPGDEPWAILDAAEQITNEAASLTGQLLTFAKAGTPVAAITAFKDFLATSAKFTLRGTAYHYEFSINDDLWPVKIDHGQIYQVLHNLILNACQAMPESGSVKIGASNTTIKKGDTLPLQPGRYVRFWIADKGCGIDERHRDQIFDPYFTTKDSGNGLGLSVCRTIVANHGGHIDVQSCAGKGSCFAVFLPAHNNDSTSDSNDACDIVTGTGRILFMDDDPSVRLAAKMMLERLGYEVAVCENGTQAIDIYREAAQQQPFNLVILDLTVRGGMGGVATIEKLREINPSVKAALITGYSDDSVFADSKNRGFCEVIAKPFGLHELSRIVSRLMP